jgi:polysaccharide export outer membrane protein
MNMKRFIFVSVVMGFALFAGSSAFWQQRVDTRTDRQTVGPASAAPQPEVDGSKLYGGYMIGVGDIINIRIAEEDDVSGRYQVSESGDVKIPLLEKPIHADGLTTFDLSSKLSEELKKQQILKDPYVTVFIERGMTQNVTVSGPVARPGIYPIERPTKLLDVLSMSGGLAPNAGQTITISHAAAEQKTAATGGPSAVGDQKTGANGSSSAAADPKTGANAGSNAAVSENIDVVTLMSGDNREANVLVKPGDNITVSNASVVYVVGAVTRPGAFVVQDPKNGLSVLKAIALVEGTTSTAKMGSAIIVRKSTNEEGREEIPLDLSKIQKGKVKDPILMANDILFVPTSAMKQGLKRMGDAAQVAAGYGMGLRIAP